MTDDFNLTKFMASDLYRQLRSMNLLDETELRNAQIRDDYEALRVEHHVSACIEILMEKYCLAWDTLKNIIFRK